jgi:THO complex subunit 2
MVKNNWLAIIGLYLFPGLSMAEHNPGLSCEIWELVKLFPYDTRYALYGEWKYTSYEQIPELRIAKAGCIRDCKYILRYNLSFVYPSFFLDLIFQFLAVSQKIP